MSNNETRAVLDEMHRAWPADEPRLASQPINQDVVDEVCWRLIQKGIQPTCDHIRIVHGAGSPTTIHRMIRAFFAKGELERRWNMPPTPSIPTGFNDAWCLAVRAVRKTMAGEFEAEAKAVGEKMNAVVKREQICKLETTEANYRVAEADARVTSSEEETARLRSQLAAEKQERQVDAVGRAATIAALEATAEAERNQHRTLLADSQSKLSDAERENDELVDHRNRTTNVIQRISDKLDAAIIERDELRSRLDQAIKDERIVSLALAAAEGRILELERIT